ncbi:accessory protein [memana virus]|uniref:Accessory protein n=1 Tax=memana virus TaxID=2940997 RepID=A0AAE9HTY5_9MONO|nr:accessory protein [memana virus]
MGSKFWKILRRRERRAEMTPQPRRQQDQSQRRSREPNPVQQSYPLTGVVQMYQPGQQDLERLQNMAVGRQLCLVLDLMNCPVNTINLQGQEEVTIHGMVRVMAEILAETGVMEMVDPERLQEVPGLTPQEKINLLMAAPLLLLAFQTLRRYSP